MYPRWRIFVFQALLVAGAVALIEFAVRWEWISVLFVSRPSTWFGAFRELLFEENLLTLVGITLSEVAITFLIGSVAGLLLGYLLYYYRKLGDACTPLFGAVFASPLILLYPIALVIFGRTSKAIIAMALIFGTLPIILHTRNSFLHISSTLIDVGRSLNLTQRQIFVHIMLPAAAPLIFTGIRLGLIYMLISIVAMEYLVALGGLGNLVSDAYFRLNTEELYVGVLCVTAISVLFFAFLRRGQRWMERM